MDYPTIIEIVTSTKTLLLHPGNFAVSAKGRADFVTNVDVEVQRYLQEHLASLYPDVIMLAEEQERLTIEEDKAYWILDPIDGTQNFIRQMQCSAVSLAYYAEGSLQFGVSAPTLFTPISKLAAPEFVGGVFTPPRCVALLVMLAMIAVSIAGSTRAGGEGGELKSVTTVSKPERRSCVVPAALVTVTTP